MKEICPAITLSVYGFARSFSTSAGLNFCFKLIRHLRCSNSILPHLASYGSIYLSAFWGTVCNFRECRFFRRRSLCPPQFLLWPLFRWPEPTFPGIPSAFWPEHFCRWPCLSPGCSPLCSASPSVYRSTYADYPRHLLFSYGPADIPEPDIASATDGIGSKGCLLAVDVKRLATGSGGETIRRLGSGAAQSEIEEGASPIKAASLFLLML